LSADLPQTDAAAPATPKAAPRRRRWIPSRRHVHKWVLVVSAVTLLLLTIVAGTVRFGIRTESGRAFAMRFIEGLKIGRYGRLHVEGLQGDLFGSFTVRRLSVRDERGDWIRASNLAVTWRPMELSARRVHVERIRAEVIQVLRRPIQTPPSGEPPRPMSVSVAVDDLRTRLETLPAFSSALGIWDVTGQADFLKGGLTTARLDAQSRLHVGDGLRLALRLEPEGRLLMQADAVEASGGAMAGSIGLPANQRLFVRGRVDGRVDGEGRLSIVAESGNIRPVVASGAWGPNGATLDAKFLLDASALTAGYAARVGPDATVKLRAAPLREGVYRVEGTVVAREAQIALNGPVDWRRRRAEGVNLRVAVSALERWVGAVHAGPTRFNGVLTGAVDRWRYQGRMEIDRFNQFGFSAARMAGPAIVSRVPGDTRLQTDLSVVGGAGRGLVPGLLGPAPRIRLDGSRLRQGRLLARDLHITGAGMEVDATGDRTLLGGLALKGTIALSRLERAHAGAKGTVRASWTADQRGLSPWSVRFDAKGTEFASGYPEIDRLLGTAPRFLGQATYGAEGLAIQDSDLTGDKAQAAIKGTLLRDLSLAMDVDWRASGPFTAGPVEIAGEATGTGHITGALGAPTLDLSADLASMDFGRLVVTPAHLTLLLATEGGMNGRVAVTGASTYGPARAAAAFRFIPGGIALSEIDADAGGVKTSGALTLRDGAPSTADLVIDAGPGALLSGGRLQGAVRIAEAPGGPTARINLNGQNLAAPGLGGPLKTLRLIAEGPWARLPFNVQAEAEGAVAWKFAGDGVMTQSETPSGAVRDIALSGSGTVRQAPVRTLEPIRLHLAPGETSVRLRASVGEGRVNLDARQAGETMEARGDVAGLAMATFAEDYVGRLTGAFTLNGQGQRLGGTLDAAIRDGRNRDAPESVALNGRVRAVLADTRVQIDASATNAQGLTSELGLNLPAEASAAPFRIALIRNQPVRGSFSAEGELRPLWDLLIGGGRTLSGRGVARGTIAGTLADLDASGQASLAGGRFQDAATGLDLQDLALAASFGESAIRVDRFSGQDGQGGLVSGSGAINLNRGGASTFTLDLQRFQLIDNDLAKASASGQVTVTRDAAGKAKLEGAITIVRADITAQPPVPTGVTPLDVIEINRPVSDRAQFRVRPPGPQVALDVKITAPRGVFVRGNGLDIEFSVDAHVGGATGSTLLTGTARVVRGNYQFAGKRFEFDERSLVRLGPRAELIRLDLTAVREDPTLTAVVRIEGTAARPEITLSSQPILPQDEVLSQVLFGRTASQLTPLETAQLASALTSLATGGGLDVLGGLRELAGLDRLALGGDAEGQATVSGGKYLTDDIYLELTGGGRNGPTAQVEWRVRRNFSIVSTVGTRGDARLSIRFRRGR
jgi:translocation and assembly module TamB